MRTVFLGYDPREHEAFNVAQSSILRRSKNIVVVPLCVDHLATLLPAPIRRDGRLWDIESDAPMSTEFARTRFCVPFLQKRGWAVFADSDIVCLADMNELFDLADERYAVMVVKHKSRQNLIRQSDTILKMDGQIQTFYQRKNWSSVILWNLAHPGHDRLSKDRLNNWPGRDLHAFKWLEDDEIGELPAEWNYLVSVDPEGFASKAKLMHFTMGGPFLEESPRNQLDYVWRTERAACAFR